MTDATDGEDGANGRSSTHRRDEHEMDRRQSRVAETLRRNRLSGAGLNNIVDLSPLNHFLVEESLRQGP